MVERKAKGSKLKNLIIIVLIILLVGLLYSGTVDETTKGRFWTTLLVFGVIVGGAYMFLFKKKKINVLDIAKQLVFLEYVNFGRKINVSDVNIDRLDAETLVFGFESIGELVTYKWDIINDALVGRLNKKLDSVKDEVNKREIMRELAARSQKKSEERKVAAEEGFELTEEA